MSKSLVITFQTQLFFISSWFAIIRTVIRIVTYQLPYSLDIDLSSACWRPPTTKVIFQSLIPLFKTLVPQKKARIRVMMLSPYTCWSISSACDRVFRSGKKKDFFVPWCSKNERPGKEKCKQKYMNKMPWLQKVKITVIYEDHWICFQTFIVWALLLIIHTWNSSPLRSNLLWLQCTCCTVPSIFGKSHGSPLVWACQWPSLQPLSSPQLSHNDSLWALGIIKSHREQGQIIGRLMNWLDSHLAQIVHDKDGVVDWCIVLVEMPLTRFEECWPLP